MGEKNLPQEKRDLIVRTLQNTLTTDNINKVEDGESQLKRVFTKIIDMVRQIIPYNRMLISSDGYLIPLDDRYFRIDAQNLGFKYGGEITCVGMITNIIGEDTDPNDSQNIFATLQFSVNEVLRQLLPTKERNLCVIHPIAVYYGN